MEERRDTGTPKLKTGLARIAQLVARARTAAAPVVWVQDQDDQRPVGSEGWEIVDELEPATDEAVVGKVHGDSFEDTDLEAVLALHRVGRLVVTGAHTDACVRATIHGAFTRGYDVTLVGDAHTTEDRSAWGAPPPDQVVAHTNLYWAHQTAPGRTAEVVPTAAVTFDATTPAGGS